MIPSSAFSILEAILCASGVTITFLDRGCITMVQACPLCIAISLWQSSLLATFLVCMLIISQPLRKCVLLASAVMVACLSKRGIVSSQSDLPKVRWGLGRG